MANFFKNLFKSKTKVEETPKNILVAVADGDAIPLSEVPDQVFAQKLAGDGAAIMVKGNTIVAPADGELTLVFNTIFFLFLININTPIIITVISKIIYLASLTVLLPAS